MRAEMHFVAAWEFLLEQHLHFFFQLIFFYFIFFIGKTVTLYMQSGCTQAGNGHVTIFLESCHPKAATSFQFGCFGNDSGNCTINVDHDEVNILSLFAKLNRVIQRAILG